MFKFLRYTFIYFSITIVVCMFDCMASPGLIGVINNSKNCEIWVGQPEESGSVQVMPKQPAYFKSVPIPDTKVNAISHKFDKNLRLIVRRKGSVAPWFVEVAQTDVFGNQFLVAAQTSDGKIYQETWVTNALNSAYIPGLPANPWQGVVIAFKDEAVASEGTEIPFSFALSAWASNKEPWLGADDGPHFLKLNKTSDGSIIFKDKDGKTQYLNIIQGQQALGGGIVPRRNHAHIVHIYNNTSRALDIKRITGKGKGDSIVIPPQSVVPYIMEWVPVRMSKDANLAEALKPVIRIALVRPAKMIDALKPDESLIAGAAGQTPTTEADVDAVLAAMGLSSPSNAASIMGANDIMQLMKPEGINTKWNISGIVYKIFADENKKIYIYSRDMGKEDASDVLMYSTDPLLDPAYIDRNQPGYFALVLSENVDVENPITFRLINLKKIERP